MGIRGWQSPIFVNFAPTEAQNGTNRPARPCCNVMLLGFCDSHAYHIRVACGCRIGICGYTAVPEDGRICLLLKFDMSFNDNMHGGPKTAPHLFNSYGVINSECDKTVVLLVFQDNREQQYVIKRRFITRSMLSPVC